MAASNNETLTNVGNVSQEDIKIQQYVKLQKDIKEFEDLSEALNDPNGTYSVSLETMKEITQGITGIYEKLNTSYLQQIDTNNLKKNLEEIEEKYNATYGKEQIGDADLENHIKKIKNILSSKISNDSKNIAEKDNHLTQEQKETMLLEEIAAKKVEVPSFLKNIKLIEEKLIKEFKGDLIGKKKLRKEYQHNVEQLATEINEFVHLQIAKIEEFNVKEKIASKTNNKSTAIIANTFNFISHFLIYDILVLSKNDPKSQEIAIIRWGNVLNELLAKGDYFSAFAIFASLNKIDNLFFMEELKRKNPVLSENIAKLNEVVSTTINPYQMNMQLSISKEQNVMPYFPSYIQMMISTEESKNESIYPNTTIKNFFTTIQSFVFKAKLTISKIANSTFKNDMHDAYEHNTFALKEDDMSILKRMANKNKGSENLLSSLEIKSLVTSHVKQEKAITKYLKLGEKIKKLKKSNGDEIELRKMQTKQENYRQAGDINKITIPLKELRDFSETMQITSRILLFFNSNISYNMLAINKENLIKCIMDEPSLSPKLQDEYKNFIEVKLTACVDLNNLDQSNLVKFISDLNHFNDGLNEKLNKMASVEDIQKYLDHCFDKEKKSSVYLKMEPFIQSIYRSVDKLKAGEDFYKNNEEYQSLERLNDYVKLLENRKVKQSKFDRSTDEKRFSILKDTIEKLKKIDDDQEKTVMDKINAKIQLINKEIINKDLTSHHTDLKGKFKEKIGDNTEIKKITRPIKLLTAYRKGLEQSLQQLNKNENHSRNISFVQQQSSKMITPIQSIKPDVKENDSLITDQHDEKFIKKTIQSSFEVENKKPKPLPKIPPKKLISSTALVINTINDDYPLYDQIPIKQQEIPSNQKAIADPYAFQNPAITEETNISVNIKKNTQENIQSNNKNSISDAGIGDEKHYKP